MAEDYMTKADGEAMELRLLERMEKVETHLLTEFRLWARRIEGRQKVQETESPFLRARIEALEEKVFGTTTEG